MLHIKKEQRRMHKQTMKDAIGPPQQLGHPNGSNYQYHQQQPQQPGGYPNQPHDQSYGNNNQNGESYGGNMRPNSDQRNHRRPGFEGRDPSFNRPVIGAEYEPSHLHSPPMTQDMEYLNQVRKHQQELQTQESIREEYRMRNRQAERRMPIQTQGSFQCLSPRSPQLQSPSLHSPQLHSPQLHSPRLHSPRMHSPGSFGRLMPGPQPQVGSQGPGLSQVQGFHQGPPDSRPRPPQQIGIPGQMQQRGRDQYEFSHHAVRPPSVSGFPSLNSSMSQERSSTHLPLMLDPELEQSMRLLSVQNNEIHHQSSNGSQSLRLVFPPHSQSESRRGSMHSQSGTEKSNSSYWSILYWNFGLLS